MLERAAKTWREHCHRWGIRVDAPYAINVEGCLLSCIAFLPDFGGPSGMIIGVMNLPEISTDKRIQKWARERGLFCSFVNIRAFIKDETDDEVFKEALEDWGYYGEHSSYPEWFRGYKGCKALP
jgi:hypothetical protein